jgi:hypothetical protein
MGGACDFCRRLVHRTQWNLYYPDRADFVLLQVRTMYPPITYYWTVPLIYWTTHISLGTWQIQKWLRQTPGYVEVLWGIDADPKVSVASVALVMSDLTQPWLLGYVRPDITVSWEFIGYVRPDITESWEFLGCVRSDITEKFSTYGYVRSDITEKSRLRQVWHNRELRIVGYVRPDITESWELSVMSDLT